MRFAAQTIGMVITLVLGILFGMDYAEHDHKPALTPPAPVSAPAQPQAIQVTPKEGKVEISVVDKPGSQVVKVESDKEKPKAELKGSTLGQVTNSIGSGIRGQTRKILESFFQ